MISASRFFSLPQKIYRNNLPEIWKKEKLSNTDSFVLDLEQKFEKHLKVSNLLFVKNPTYAFQIAIKLFDLKGEIITTPFNSLLPDTSSEVNAWGKCSPVFVDVEETTLNIDVKKIEASITSKTSAIFTTHVLGNPCDVIEIDRIAKKHNLKVIYDGSHAFGVQINDRSVFNYGDVCIASTSSTKLFPSFEGAFMIHNKKSDFSTSKHIRNTILLNSSFCSAGIDINKQNKQFITMVGDMNLSYIHQVSEKRKVLANTYDEYLRKLEITKLFYPKNTEYNSEYYPVMFTNEEFLLRCLDKLESFNISASRSLHPLFPLDDYVISEKLKVADDVSKRILFLPLHFNLNVDKVALICGVIQYEFLLSEGKLG